jgi:hypothetical protein
MSTRPNLGRKRVPLLQPATKGETYWRADTGHARHLGKRDAGLRRNREKGYDWGRAWLIEASRT